MAVAAPGTQRQGTDRESATLGTHDAAVVVDEEAVSSERVSVFILS